jgi:tetratricopeptide (TPR) repeat protein
MNDIPPSDNGSLPLDVEEQVDKICDRFEDAWKQGQRPRIEDYLAILAEPGRSTLLRELIKLDIVYRRRAGENPTAEDYRERFPNLDPPAADSTVIESPGPLHRPPEGGPVSASAAPTGRYQLGNEIGHGGMGTVIQGRDPDLGREVAIKVLLPAHQDQPEMVQRFLDEARVGGQLQHPGVVPVHERGTFPDGRPYLTMKLVKGRTLADLLKERPDPARDLPRFLKIFEQVCQTLAYAHAKGVIHRDLKPANVMVGAFGEVHVMDWGLAKVLPEAPRRGRESAEERPDSVIETARSADVEAGTQRGKVMGTYAYMPPEQARGEVDRLDERCDVFGLGALLCVILTGKPPYRGGREEVLNAAQQGDQADALTRLDSCGADADLVRLAKECLQPQVEDRPRNAPLVAEYVTAYLVGVQERLRQAEMERAAAQAREEEARARAEAEAQALRAERRARQRTLALAASLLLLLSGVGAAGWWYQQQQAAQALRQEQAAGEVKGALREVVQLRARALTLLDNPESWKVTLEAAGLAVKRAETLLQQEPQLAGTPLAQEVQQSRAELEADAKDHRLVTAFEKVLFKASEFDRRYTTADVYQEVHKALGQWGLPLAELPKESATSLVQQRPRGIQDQLAAILHFCLSCTPPAEKKQTAWLREVLAAADPDPWRQQVRQAVANGDVVLLEKLVDKADVAQQPPIFLFEVSRKLWKGNPRRIALLRRAQQQHPGDFWVNCELGGALYESVFGRRGEDRPARAEELPVVNEAVAFGRVAVGLRPGNAAVHNNLGWALYGQGDVARAMACYRKALDLDPKYAPAHSNLGVVLQAQGDLDGAIACYTQALEVDPKDALAHNNLGNALKAQGDVKGAIACYQKALELNSKDALAHNNLGAALHEQGDLKGAIAYYHKALALDPKFAMTHNNLGEALRAKGNLDGAIACCTKALELDPKCATAHNNLGAALHEQGDLKGAIACYRKAIALDPTKTKTHINLGLALDARGDFKGAMVCYKKALDLDPKFATAHDTLGTALYHQKDWKGAIACYKKALDLDPKFARAHNHLGLALEKQGDLKGAITHYQKAIDLDPKDGEAHCNLGYVLRAQGHFAQALQALKQGHAIGAKRADWRYPSARWVEECQRLLDLDARLSAIDKGEAQAKDAADRLQLADLCVRYKKRYLAAVRFYIDAFAAKPKLTDDLQADHRYNAACAAALVVADQGADASKLDAKEKSRLCQQALAWLQDNLKGYTGQLDDLNAKQRADLQKTLQHWQQDADLASVRDADALTKLPEAERDSWRQLWADVASLLKRAAGEK